MFLIYFLNVVPGSFLCSARNFEFVPELPTNTADWRVDNSQSRCILLTESSSCSYNTLSWADFILVPQRCLLGLMAGRTTTTEDVGNSRGS